MPIYYGGKKISSLYYGGKKIASAWYGGKQVYSSAYSSGQVLFSGNDDYSGPNGVSAGPRDYPLVFAKAKKGIAFAFTATGYVGSLSNATANIYLMSSGSKFVIGLSSNSPNPAKATIASSIQGEIGISISVLEDKITLLSQGGSGFYGFYLTSIYAL